MESGGGVGEFKRDEQALFGSESPGFVNLVFCEPITEFTGTPRATEVRSRGFQFHEAILSGNSRFVTIMEFLQPSFQILRQLFPLRHARQTLVIGHPS
jgi:hypothetical protein